MNPLKLLHNKTTSPSKRTMAFLLLSLLIHLSLSFYFYLRLSDSYYSYLEENFSLITNDPVAKSDTNHLVDILSKTRTTYSWVCIKGLKGNIIFFDQKNDNCEENLFRKKISIENPNNPEIKLEAIVQMPKNTNWLILSVVIFLAIVTCFSILALSNGLEKDHASKLRLEKIENEKEKYQAMAQLKIARQVAHDIRSPLSALDMIVSSSESLPEEEKRIVKHAVRRIHDIANNLLNKSKTTLNIAETKRVLIAPLIESLISEKRMQYRSLMNIIIEVEFTENSLGLFVNINESDLKRVLSNLINNSVEAFNDEKGKITIKIRSDQNTAKIEILDNGPGIPENILKSLTTDSPISTKVNGNAIGLKSAKEIINLHHGSLEINSKLEQGTSIIITLPLSKIPSWYQKGLIISKKEIVIIDDDKTIHQLWMQKFSQVNFQGKIENYTDFENEINQTAQYLIDYEFLGQDFNGLDKIIELKIPNAILVTSHYDEETIQNKCIKHGIRIIPKSAIPYLPIKISIKDEIDLILLDDDELIRLSWENSAKKQNKKITSFSTSLDLLKEIDQFNKETPIYLDSELGEESKGQDIALKLFNLGYKNLILCTGHSPEQFKNMPWLSKIQGKTYPSTP